MYPNLHPKASSGLLNFEVPYVYVVSATVTENCTQNIRLIQNDKNKIEFQQRNKATSEIVKFCCGFLVVLLFLCYYHGDPILAAKFR